MKSYALMLAGCLLLTCGCVSQQDLYHLDDRVAALERRNLALERQNERLQAQMDKVGRQKEQDNQSLRNQSAGLRAELEANSDQLRTLSGRTEEIEYELRQRINGFEMAQVKLEKRLETVEDQNGRFEQKIARLEQYLNLETQRGTAAAVKPPPTVPAKPDAGGDGNEEALYRSAKQAIDKGDLENAREGFLKLLGEYPKSRNADNAQYWIGETYYQEKWYEKAILEYQKVIEKYPNGNKVPASLLKQGFAFLNLGDKANARLILKELSKKYPDSKEAAIAQKKLKSF